MARYDYECQDCKTVQEKDHKMSETNKEPCEKCNASAEKLKKLLSPVSKHLSWSKWNV
jgi:putative FmdB family regulatory protein